MLRLTLLILSLTGCGGVAYQTTVADSAAVRRAMITSVFVGETTKTAFVTRWGPPLQKQREGAREEFIYRSQNNSNAYVIVTFDFGVAIAVRSNETEGCRGTFPARVPGFGFDRPDPVAPVGWCDAIPRLPVQTESPLLSTASK